MTTINDLILNFVLQIGCVIGLVGFGMQLQKQLDRYRANKKR